MSTADPWTVGRLLKWTTDYLQSHESETPRLDAEVLLAEALHCQRIELYTRFEEVPADDARGAFRELVRRRAEGTPVAYLVGHREFYSLSFRVTPDVLIPRPETELLVLTALDLAKGISADSLAIADIGTGSGAIAVSLAKHLSKCRVTAVDISPVALAIARENAHAHGVADRIEFVESDLLAAVPVDKKFHLIVSNPPYVTEAEYQNLARDVRDFEPRGALVAGPQGTEIIERIIAQAAERLLPGGYLLIEFSPTTSAAAREIVAADARFEQVDVLKDLARLPRVLQARRVE